MLRDQDHTLERFGITRAELIAILNPGYQEATSRESAEEINAVVQNALASFRGL